LSRSPSIPDPEQELATLARKLEDRSSIVHFAWAFGLACTAFVAGGVSIKLFRDSIRTPKVAFLLGAIAAVETVIALWRLQRGFKLHAAEVAEFERMQSLRRQLGVDRPRLPSA
jgi:hypothetical protein